ncbi:MAG: MFS transporter [Proteobacteria bacterium]|nr:MFS transporter [Pseudomonadota bacterium]
MEYLNQLAPILILLVVVAIVIARLPNVEGVNHSVAFKKRRVFNWLPLGLTYAFLYMGRYNLKVSKFAFEEMSSPEGEALMSNNAFSTIFFWGVIVYGISFLINGPLTDKYGGKFSILVGAGGSLLMNMLMGMCTLALINDWSLKDTIIENFVFIFSLLYALNMYFQSFGAVAIVKVNAPWFHIRERGVFGAIFGVLISLGVYFAFDWSSLILNIGVTESMSSAERLDLIQSNLPYVFFVPTILLCIFWVIDLFIVKNTPGEAGMEDFDTADASSGDEGPQLSAMEVFKKMLTNPIILTIAMIEFCSGFLRQAIMQWYRTFAKQTDVVLGLKGDFVYDNWGLLLCCAGIMGGVVAGTISDHVFQSRRGPVAAVLYGAMFLGAIALYFVYDSHGFEIAGIVIHPQAWLVLFMSMAVIGVHGMLSGTASMDFGGKKNVGIAVGIIDGFVYLGTGVMSLTYGIVLPQEEIIDGKLAGPATDPANWSSWPISMIPLALVGLLLATRVWNAKPKPKGTNVTPLTEEKEG